MRNEKSDESVKAKDDWVGSPTASSVMTSVLPVWFDANVL